MKNYNLSELFRDFEFVKKAIQNPENKEEHTKPLYKLVRLFENKHGWSNDYTMYLDSEIIKLKDKIYERKIKS